MGKPTLLHAVLLSFMVLHCLLAASDAEIKTGRFTGDTNILFVLGRFAFDPHGRVAISLSDVTVTPSSSPPSRPPDYSRMGFFVASEGHIWRTIRKRLRPSPQRVSRLSEGEGFNASRIEELLTSSSFCALYNIHVRRLFTLRELSPPRYNAYNGTFDIPEADEYLVVFTNCAPGWRTSMAFHAEMYTVRVDGSRDYLSSALFFFPAVYTAFAGAYLVFLAIWLYVYLWRGELHRQWQYQQLPLSSTPTHRVHHLMAGLLLAKGLNLICFSEDLRNVAATGTHHSWDGPFYLFRLAKGALLLNIVFLAWSGWPYLQPCLQRWEKRILSVVLPLQVLANTAFTAAGGGDGITPSVAGDSVSWGWAVILVDVVSGLAVMYSVTRSMRAQREASYKGDGKAMRSLARVVLFRRFYVVAMTYLYLTWILVLAMGWLVEYERRWVGAALEEGATLAFFAYMCYAFRPDEKDMYTSLSE